MFRQKHGGAALPDYVVVEESSDELKEVCYRALVENSPADQYQVAMLLRQQLASKVKETEAGPIRARGVIHQALRVRRAERPSAGFIALCQRCQLPARVLPVRPRAVRRRAWR